MKWWDWLLCSSHNLKKQGLDPEERICYTGHKRALSPRWAQTIGMWCRAKPATIMDVISPGDSTKEEKDRTRSAYDIFKYRHKLQTSAPFMKTFMDPPIYSHFMEISRVMVATYSYARVISHMSRSMLNLGSASELAMRVLLGDGENLVEDHFGLLPIEAMLYYNALEKIFASTDLTFRIWSQGTSKTSWLDRAEQWRNHDCDSIVMLPAEALERYPLAYAQDD